MKILYLSFSNPEISFGVYRKELEFCKNFKYVCKEKNIHFKGYNIAHFSFKVESYLQSYDYFEVINTATDIYNKFYKRNKILRNLHIYANTFNIANTILIKEKPSIVLLRSTYPLVFNPKKINVSTKVVTEHQTMEFFEKQASLPKYYLSLLKLIDKIYYKSYSKIVDGVVGVTSEITEYEIQRLNKPNIYRYTLTNSIDVKKYPIKKYISLDKALNMIFVASFTSKWHGVDRLLKGLARYQGDYKITLHIVGDVSEDIKTLIHRLKLNNVLLHGKLFGKDLDKLFDVSHLAIGTLGLHRKNLKYASTLKVREYMARGIPFVISYNDEDLDENFPFYLKLEANDEPIDINIIINFARRIYETDKNFSLIMRKYALNKMDFSVKLPKFLDFLLRIK